MEAKEDRFLDMIRQHQTIVYKIATLYTNNKEDREDLMQEIFYQLWKSFDSFKKQSKISTWLYRVSMNTAIQHLKKNSRKVKAQALREKHAIIEAASSDPREEAINKMLASIQQLNEMEKGIILLYLEEKSHKEIAEIIGLSISNVGTKIQRIKTKLNKLNKH